MAFLGRPSEREDGGGPVTYRHLLSPQAMTVFNPLRVIAHCDIDAAYAQFEQVRLGLPDTVPLICAQWQSIIAVNYPARKYGIKRFTTLDEAKKMCPHLVVQHVATYRNGETEAGYWEDADRRTHKVSLDPYRRESLKILAIFKEMVPRGEIEKASIDEAFLDLTMMVIQMLLERFPYLDTVPDDAPDGLDSSLPPPPPIDWTRAGNVVPTPAEQVASTEDEGGGEPGSEDGQGEQGWIRRAGEATWEDWALYMGAEIMVKVRHEVWTRLHYTCSAGIANNKAMSKLCSAWKKPNAQTVLRKSATPSFLRDMDFTDIRYLGGKLGSAMADEYGAKTVGDMLSVSLEEMQSRFGEESVWVYNILRGIDHTQVTPRLATKSMLASKNIIPNLRKPREGDHWLGVLAGELNVRLNDAREISPGVWPKTLVLSFRQSGEASRSRQIPFPFTKALSTEYIVKYARKLWDEATQPMLKGNMKLNNIALGFTGLERMEQGQKGIESFFGAKPLPPLKRSRSTSSSPDLEATTESKTEPTVSAKKTRLPTLHTAQRKTALESFLVKTGQVAQPSDGAKSVVASHIIDMSHEADDTHLTQDSPLQRRASETRSLSWTCPRCVQVVDMSQDDSLDGNTQSEIFTAMKREHQDYHFALDLQNGVDPSSSASASSGSANRASAPSASSKKKNKPTGIKAFFTAKPPLAK